MTQIAVLASPQSCHTACVSGNIYGDDYQISNKNFQLSLVCKISPITARNMAKPDTPFPFTSALQFILTVSFQVFWTASAIPLPPQHSPFQKCQHNTHTTPCPKKRLPDLSLAPKSFQPLLYFPLIWPPLTLQHARHQHQHFNGLIACFFSTSY
jgi:hypothetical protein